VASLSLLKCSLEFLPNIFNLVMEGHTPRGFEEFTWRLGSARSIDDYPMLWKNDRFVQMRYRVDTLQGAIEMWMSEMQCSDDWRVDISILRLEKGVLGRHDIPCGIWDFYPRPPVLWTLIWCHYVCDMLGLPDPCNIQCQDVQIVPQAIFDAVQEHFDDDPEPPFWDSILDATSNSESDDGESFSSSPVQGVI
jgi:hypothetical protein